MAGTVYILDPWLNVIRVHCIGNHRTKFQCVPLPEDMLEFFLWPDYRWLHRRFAEISQTFKQWLFDWKQLPQLYCVFLRLLAPCFSCFRCLPLQETAECLGLWCSPRMFRPSRPCAVYTVRLATWVQRMLLELREDVYEWIVSQSKIFPSYLTRSTHLQMIANVAGCICIYVCIWCIYVALGLVLYPRQGCCHASPFVFPHSEVHPRGFPTLQEAVPGCWPTMGWRPPTVAQLQWQWGLWVSQTQFVLLQGQKGHQPKDVLHQQEPHHARPGEQVW